MDSDNISADHVLSLAQSMYPDEIDALVVQLTASPSQNRDLGAVAFPAEHQNHLTFLDERQGSLPLILPEVERCRHGSLSSASEYESQYSPVTPASLPADDPGAMAFSFEGSPPSSPSQWENFQFRLDLELAETILRSEAQGPAQVKEEPYDPVFQLADSVCSEGEDAGDEPSQGDPPTGSVQIRFRDENRRLRRREQNRRAAKKCRLKKQAQHQALVQEYRKLENSNSELQKKLETLQTETRRLRDVLRAHMTTCTLRFSTSDQCQLPV